MKNDINVLEEFLNMSVFSTDEVFNKFETDIGGKVYDIDGVRFYYKEGTRDDKILLVAHADTIWDKRYIDDYDKLNQKPINNIAGTYFSGSMGIGIGADDRAGVAIVWLLKDTGNSILITDLEEHGAVAARTIMKDTIFSEIINHHKFMLQFDLKGNRNFKCYNVGNAEFKKMIERKIRYKMLPNYSFTDICFLGKKICGANLSVGYYNEHSEDEKLKSEEWLLTLKMARKLANAKHKQYYTNPDFAMEELINKNKGKLHKEYFNRQMNDVNNFEKQDEIVIDFCDEVVDKEENSKLNKEITKSIKQKDEQKDIQEIELER